MSGITGLNHLTLSVGDLDRSVTFYSDLLGLSVRMRSARSAYLEAGSLWLALVLDPDVRKAPLSEYSHIAFAIAESDFPRFVQQLTDAGVTSWQEPERSNSFYFLDPDGHKLELHSGNLASRLRERGIEIA